MKVSRCASTTVVTKKEREGCNWVRFLSVTIWIDDTLFDRGTVRWISAGRHGVPGISSVR